MLLTVSEVAKMLKVNRNFVYKLIKDGELEAVKVGSIKVSVDALNIYIQSKKLQGVLLVTKIEELKIKYVAEKQSLLREFDNYPSLLDEGDLLDDIIADLKSMVEVRIARLERLIRDYVNESRG